MIRTTVDSIVREINAAQEDYVIALFGSVENFARIAHLYIIEEEKMENTAIGNHLGDHVLLRATVRWRIRQKTMTELGHKPTESGE